MDGARFVLLAGGICKTVRNGPEFFSTVAGHVAAAESICMNLHLLDKVLYGGITISKVFYEFAHHG
jgi:hypothetical protein